MEKREKSELELWHFIRDRKELWRWLMFNRNTMRFDASPEGFATLEECEENAKIYGYVKKEEA